MSWIRARIDRVRYLWRVALEENADPRRFALAVAVGTLVSALPVPPAFGLRSFAALFGAWVARCSKLTAWLSSHVFVLPIWVPLAIWQVRVGSFLLGRAPPSFGGSTSENLTAARHALLAWWTGGVVIAPVFAALAYAIALPIARKYRARREKTREAREGETTEDRAETPSGAE